MNNYFIAWQEYPRQTGFGGWFRVYTDNPEIAYNIRQRKKSSECIIIGEKAYLFQIKFINKEKALNSFNTLLARYNYPKLKYNAKNEEFTSNMPPNLNPKKKERYINA